MVIRKEREIKTIYAIILLLFAAFLAVPIIRLLMESFVLDEGRGLANYFILIIFSICFSHNSTFYFDFTSQITY